MSSLALVGLLALGAAAPPKSETPLAARQREKQELVEQLERDLFKVDRTVAETERLLETSRSAPYLPDLLLRLGELYVEKSRYWYALDAETRPPGQSGSLVSPETRLLKQQAVRLYERILREFPDFKDADKVTFFLAHEQRELGDFSGPPGANMLETLAELIRRYPSSPLRADAEQILGDYWFDRKDLAQAERHYRAVLEGLPSPAQDLARYKLGWIRVNQGNHAEAVGFFEAAVTSAPVPGVDPARGLGLKREALLDLVYSYTEARPGKGAVQYFERLSDTRVTLALALDKLGSRYFLKQQPEYAVLALRRLLDVQTDPELDVERAERLYDSLKAARGKVQPRAVDVGFLVRAAVQLKKDPDRSELARKKALDSLEVMARDLATTLHLEATKRGDRALLLESAEAYRTYLSLFRPSAFTAAMMQNRADALFAAKRFPEAARQFEELAQVLDAETGKAREAAAGAVALETYEEALYGALVSHSSSLAPGEIERLGAFEVADARRALELLGARYVARYPKSVHVVEVKLGVARAYYEDGALKRSAELFKELALSAPEHRDAVTAASLSLDALRQARDHAGVRQYAQEYLASRLPQSFKRDVERVLTESWRAQMFDDVTSRLTRRGDVVSSLLSVAGEHPGEELGEQALYQAFGAVWEKRDLQREREIGARFVAEYPRSALLPRVMLLLGHHAWEVGAWERAAAAWEAMGRRFPDAAGLEALVSAARLRVAMGDLDGAVKVLEGSLPQAGARRAELLALLAQTELTRGQPAKARVAAEEALSLDRTNAAAAAVVMEVAAAGDEPTEPLVAMLTKVTSAPNAGGDDVAKALWYLGELLLRRLEAVPVERLEAKVAMLGELEGVYAQAGSMGSAEWAVASLWRAGVALDHLADSVEATPAPAGLKAVERDAFRATLKERARDVRQRAQGAYQACVARAEQLEVYSAAVVGCRAQTRQARTPLPAPPAARPVDVGSLVANAETSRSAADFEALGLAYLGAFHLPEATLCLRRAAELDGGRASVHTALGYALLLGGDANAARAEYGRALEADPASEKARANLGALRCRFGDVEGARRELAAVKAVAGPEVDPEWTRCRGR